MKKRETELRSCVTPSVLHISRESHNLSTVTPATFLFHTLQQICLYILSVCVVSQQRWQHMKHGHRWRSWLSTEGDECTVGTLLEDLSSWNPRQQSNTETNTWTAWEGSKKHEERVEQEEAQSWDRDHLHLLGKNCDQCHQKDSRSVIFSLSFPWVSIKLTHSSSRVLCQLTFRFRSVGHSGILNLWGQWKNIQLFNYYR